MIVHFHGLVQALKEKVTGLKVFKYALKDSGDLSLRLVIYNVTIDMTP
jgi:hypothetical protein